MAKLEGVVLSAYTTTDWSHLCGIGCYLALVLSLGAAVVRIGHRGLARMAAWTLVLVAVVGIERYTVDQPAGVRMLAVIGALLVAMKAVVTVELRPDEKARLSTWQWLAFAALWVGMRPAIFGKLPRPARTSATRFALLGCANIVGGFVLMLTAAAVANRTEVFSANAGLTVWRAVLVSAVLLPGLSLILHFGIFHLLVAFWRSWGVECEPIFNQPLRSLSLTEFWGKRWNRAFSEMTSLAVYRPVRSVGGNGVAVATAFAFSGILHELAISVPVQANYGWPTVYFLVHGLGILLENRWTVFRDSIQPHLWRSRIWTFTWIILPLPILFHPPFLRGCVWPLIGLEL